MRHTKLLTCSSYYDDDEDTNSVPSSQSYKKAKSNPTPSPTINTDGHPIASLTQSEKQPMSPKEPNIVFNPISNLITTYDLLEKDKNNEKSKDGEKDGKEKVKKDKDMDKLVLGISKRLGLPVTQTEWKQETNGERSLKITESVRGEDVFVIQSGCGNNQVNDSLMELILLISSCKHASARRVTAVLPYFPYSKQCKKKARSTISAKLIANILHVAGSISIFEITFYF